jgi:hypothetical protein
VTRRVVARLNKNTAKRGGGRLGPGRATFEGRGVCKVSMGRLKLSSSQGS